jgi:hypothetical protein
MTHSAKPAPPPSNALVFLRGLGFACATYINSFRLILILGYGDHILSASVFDKCLTSQENGRKFKPHGVIFHVRASVLSPDRVQFLGRFFSCIGESVQRRWIV